MVERGICLFDLHGTQDGFAKPYQIVRKFIKQFQPDFVIIGGDFGEFQSLSFFDRNAPLLMENVRLADECDVLNDELDFIQKNTKQTIYLEGNHEYRAVRSIESDPQKLQGNIEIPTKLHLKERGIKWVKLNSIYKRGRCYYTHGVYCGKYHAFKQLITYGCCLVYGHTHQTQTHMMNMKMQTPIMTYGIGCLCGHEPHYMRNRPANWINQFAVVENNTKTGRFNIYPVNITDNRFMYNGKEYQ